MFKAEKEGREEGCVRKGGESEENRVKATQTKKKEEKVESNEAEGKV